MRGSVRRLGRSIKVFGTRIVMEDVAGTACGKDGIHDTWHRLLDEVDSLTVG